MQELTDFRVAVLLDCDTLVVQDMAGYLSSTRFQGKIADCPTVPTELFSKLFDFFHLPMPKEGFNCTVEGTTTIPYFSAGVLVFPRQAMTDLLPDWIELNDKLIQSMDLLGQRKTFCEPASLSLAVAKSGTEFDVLGNEMNFPANHQSTKLEKVDPVIIHYHEQEDPSGYIIQNASYPLAGKRIESFNQRLRRERRQEFDNSAFWDYRYSMNPELGSGVGSRNEFKSFKQKFLKRVVSGTSPQSILDVGCGDMEVSSCLPAESYVGIDISKVVIEKNKDDYPDRSFVCGDFLELDAEPADLVLCLDVLIHLSDPVITRGSWRSW